MQPLLKGGAEGQVDPAAFFDIKRVREPTKVVVEQKSDRYRATITGPAGKGAALARNKIEAPDKPSAEKTNMAARPARERKQNSPVTARLVPSAP